MPSRTSNSAAEAADVSQNDPPTAQNALQPTQRGPFDIVSGAGSFLSRAVYTTSYGVAFGVAFPALWLARVVPTENALMHGISDGAQAARDQLSGMGHHAAERGGDLAHGANEAGPAQAKRRQSHTNHRRSGRSGSQSDSPRGK